MAETGLELDEKLVPSHKRYAAVLVPLFFVKFKKFHLPQLS